jgi:maltooligosyltrehalose trehalohydrolase
MPSGAEVRFEGVRFRLWAPHCRSVVLQIEGAPEVLMLERAGFHELTSNVAGPGTLYRFKLPSGESIPDPVSRFQPQDVHGPSEVIDPGAFIWSDLDWRGRPWEEAVIYELHVGAFTPEGTFRAAIDKLDALAKLGITTIELMPVADFPGRRNWGYDGVLLFAPDSAYGRPDDLKALIDAAHQRGLMMILDVVYNHFGPDGNYLPECGPIFTEKHHTPWGAAVNYDAQGSALVREFVISNALYWIEEFNFDGLRLDAVHTLIDESQQHILDEISERVRAAAGERHVHLILENDKNESRRLLRGPNGKPRQYTAQWNDDLHHLLHTATANELQEFYADYAGDTEKLGRSLAEGFAFQGEWTKFSPRMRGEPSAFLPPTAFISFLQNHDQVGNRPFGERFASLAERRPARAAIAILLLAPQIPLLFMGEEWAASTPFLFFCDFGDDLAEAVRNGRREEFSRYPDFQDPEKRHCLPDPISEDSFQASKLKWDEVDEGKHREWRSFYKQLLTLRHTEIVPRLRNIEGNSGRYEVLGPNAVRVCWTFGTGTELMLVANLSAERLESSVEIGGRVLWQEGDHVDDYLAPWMVIFSLQDAEHCGD